MEVIGFLLQVAAQAAAFAKQNQLLEIRPIRRRSPYLKQVAAIDQGTMKVVHMMDVPSATGEIPVRPDGKVAYVSCPIDGKVAEIDLATWKVARLIDAGAKADGLAWVK